MKSKPKEKSKKATDHPTQRDWHEMNRKQRRETMRKIQSEDLSLELVHRDAAGIDIVNESHYVAVPPSRDNQPVRRFGCTTAELKAMAAWLKRCGIRTVAMQSTGVYWIAVYDIFEQAGLEVYLVNARDTKNLPGRKSDVWLPNHEIAKQWCQYQLGGYAVNQAVERQHHRLPGTSLLNQALEGGVFDRQRTRGSFAENAS